VPATVLLGSAPAPASRRAAASSTRTLLLAAAAALLVVVVAGVLLLTRQPPVAPPVTMHVRSDPPGAQVLVDGQDSGVVTDGGRHAARGRLRHRDPHPAQGRSNREATRVLRLPLARADLRFVLEALPAVTSTVALPVVTEPPGASVTVDARRSRARRPSP
jgi:hypothetical protein